MALSIAEFHESTTPGLWIGVDQPSVVQFSADRETWTRAGILQQTATLGTVQAWPVVEVSGPLRSSPSPLQAPLYWVFGEVLAAGQAELIEDGVYRLGDLRRGLRGTQEREHPAGAEVMLLDHAVGFFGLHRSMVGLPLWWRAVPDGEDRGLARPWTASGAVCPRLDGSRPSVQGCRAEPPDAPQWGQRWVVLGEGRGAWAGWGGDIATWLDGWHRERVERGTIVRDIEDGERLEKVAKGWSSSL